MMYADIHRRCQTIGDKLHTRVIQHRAPPSIHLQYRLLVPIRPEQLVLHRIQQPVKPICVKEKYISGASEMFKGLRSRRQPERPRTTWMKTIQQDLK